VAKLVDEVLNEAGRIDLLVNNRHSTHEPRQKRLKVVTSNAKWRMALAMRCLHRRHTARAQAGTSKALFQRQRRVRDRLMSWHVRGKSQPLATNREVACFLAAGRSPSR
jgi:hypothetical protein